MKEEELLDTHPEDQVDAVIRTDLYLVIGAALISSVAHAASSVYSLCGLTTISVFFILLSTGGFVVLQYLLRNQSLTLRWFVAIILSGFTLFSGIMSFFVVC